MYALHQVVFDYGPCAVSSQVHSTFFIKVFGTYRAHSRVLKNHLIVQFFGKVNFAATRGCSSIG